MQSLHQSNDPLAQSCTLPEISFFCPAYNEEKNLAEFIALVWRFLSSASRRFEIIIVDDGSRDGTPRIADALAERYEFIRVIHHKKNAGYGITLRDGFLASRYEYVMYVDSDNQYDIREIRSGLCRLDVYDIISCCARKKAVTIPRKIQSFVYNMLVRLLFGIDLCDINCSMKLYKKKVLDAIRIQSASAFIDAEMLVKAKRLGFKILQIPVTHYPRTRGKATGANIRVITDTIKDMIKFRLGML